MKIKLSEEWLAQLATSNFATAYHYRVLLTLLTGTFTQTQISLKLGLKRQNVHRCVKDLEEHGYITVVRIEGRNKYITANTDVKALSNEIVSDPADSPETADTEKEGSTTTKN